MNLGKTFRDKKLSLTLRNYSTLLYTSVQTNIVVNIMDKKILMLQFVIFTYDSVSSQVCGNSPEFANFRRPKPLIFPSSKDEDLESARIINGDMAKQGAWPWQVKILLYIENITFKTRFQDFSCFSWSVC